MTYLRNDGKGASDMMWDAGQGGGGSYVHCGCGLDHSIDPDLTEEEYDSAESIGYIMLDNVCFVDSCEGCQTRLAKYENFIWNNRNTIRRYLKIRIDQEKIWADHESLLNTLAGI